MKKENGTWIAEGEESQEHINRYVFASHYVAGKVVLDGACGDGFGSYILAQTAKHVSGIDMESELIARATSVYKKENIDSQIGDVTKLPFPDAHFDVAVSLETIEHLDEAEQHAFLSEFRRVVKPGGMIVMSTPDKTIWRELVLHQHDHKRELTHPQFAALLTQYFSVPEFFGQHFYNPEKSGGFRKVLMGAKKLDVLNLRRLVPRGARQSIDAKTSPMAPDIVVMPVHGDQLTACMIAVAKRP